MKKKHIWNIEMCVLEIFVGYPTSESNYEINIHERFNNDFIFVRTGLLNTLQRQHTGIHHCLPIFTIIICFQLEFLPNPHSKTLPYKSCKNT